jgi:hypothetical protein
MIPKSLPSDLIREWTPVFGQDHAQVSGMRMSGSPMRMVSPS